MNPNQHMCTGVQSFTPPGWDDTCFQPKFSPKQTQQKICKRAVKFASNVGFRFNLIYELSLRGAIEKYIPNLWKGKI